MLLRKLSLTTTGLLGFSLQSLCLTLCVVSVWAPGSPFSLVSVDSVIALDPATNITLIIHDQNVTHLQPAGHDEAWTEFIMKLSNNRCTPLICRLCPQLIN